MAGRQVCVLREGRGAARTSARSAERACKCQGCSAATRARTHTHKHTLQPASICCLCACTQHACISVRHLIALQTVSYGIGDDHMPRICQALYDHQERAYRGQARKTTGQKQGELSMERQRKLILTFTQLRCNVAEWNEQ